MIFIKLRNNKQFTHKNDVAEDIAMVPNSKCQLKVPKVFQTRIGKKHDVVKPFW